MADESSNYGQIAGTMGEMLPFPLGERRAAADFPDLAKLVGMEITGQNGFKLRLVKLNIAAGLTAALAECRAFAYSALATGAARTYQVELAVLGGTTPTHRVCGFSCPEQEALTDGDLFWLVFDGPYIWGTLGDDTGDVAAGEYVQIDDDADKGKLKTTDTTFGAEYSLGLALDTVDTDGQQFRFQPLAPMKG